MATFTFTSFGSLGLGGTSFASMGVYGMSGVVTNVSVTLLGLSHTFPDDLDMLLRAPDSVHNLAFWSDAGAGTDLLNADITISDSGAVALPDGSPLTSSIGLRTMEPLNPPPITAS
jgi:hypothetical protein